MFTEAYTRIFTVLNALNDVALLISGLGVFTCVVIFTLCWKQSLRCMLFTSMVTWNWNLEIGLIQGSKYMYIKAGLGGGEGLGLGRGLMVGPKIRNEV